MRRLPSRPSADRSYPLGRAKRVMAERGGHRGEALAAWFLRAKLYKIVARRFKTPVGEIDLIAERFGTTVFVEVKARRDSKDLAGALGAVNRRRIVRAAQYFIARNPERAHCPMRFDVIFVAPFALPRHFTNAFNQD